MMAATMKVMYSEAQSLQIIELPYAGRSTSMLLLLPREIDGLDDVEASLSAESLTQWKTRFREMKVQVYLPKFTMTSQFRLDQTLQAMGMTDAFKPSQANLAGMTGKPELYVSAVIQKTYVEVNEKGTEAAAATGVGATKARGLTEPPVFRADHPFLFLVQENLTGSILFMGRVTDPTDKTL